MIGQQGLLDAPNSRHMLVSAHDVISFGGVTRAQGALLPHHEMPRYF